MTDKPEQPSSASSHNAPTRPRRPGELPIIPRSMDTSDPTDAHETLSMQRDTDLPAPIIEKAAPRTTCTNCGYINRPGAETCENCHKLLRQENITTQPLTENAIESTAPTAAQAMQTAGTSSLNEQTSLRFEITGTDEFLMLKPKQQMTIGRSDPSIGEKPELDMTPLAGYRMGVSRRHATLQLRDNRLLIHDLGSCNGTFLNGEQLTPYEVYPLRDGDEIRLGQMVLKLFFYEGGRNSLS